MASTVVTRCAEFARVVGTHEELRRLGKCRDTGLASCQTRTIPVRIAIVIYEAGQTIAGAVDTHGAPRRHSCHLPSDSSRYGVQSTSAPRCRAHQRRLRNKADAITIAFANLDTR